MMNERDAVLIQKCVDDEVTTGERRELMARLDEIPDGWKTLACSYMEDQLFSQAIRHEVLSDSDIPPLLSEAAKKPHWFYHPIMSLALSAGIAFLGGILISQQLFDRDPVAAVADRGNPEPSHDIAAGNTGTRSATRPATLPSAPDSGIYRVRLESEGRPPRDLPVFSVKDYASRSGKYWQQIGESQVIPATDDLGSKIMYMRFSTPDGQRYVIPVQQFPALPQVN